MVDPDQVYDMVDMTDRIAQGRFFGIFVDEFFVEAYLCDATLFGERLQLFVRQVARMVAKRAGRRMGGDDRVGACFKCVLKGTFGGMRDIDQYPCLIHFADDFFPERTEAVPFRVSSC